MPNLRPWLFALLLALLTTLAQAAPERIGIDIITKATTLTAGEQQSVRQYVQGWLPDLRDADEQKVVAARDKLVDPLRQNPSSFFLASYASALDEGLTVALSSDKVLTRLNAVIVASELRRDVTPIIAKALEDENPAVRYWAGKAVSEIGMAAAKDPNASGLAESQKKLLALLLPAIEKEKSQLVIQRLVSSLADLTIPEARAAVFDVLESRLAVHEAQPDLSPAPEYEALRTVLVRMAGNAANRTPDEVRRAAASLHRYLVLSAARLAKGDLDKAASADFKQMAQLGAAWLPWTARTLNATALPPALDGSVEADRWNEVLLAAEEWKQALSKPPFAKQ